jgi:hypothetical protein
MAGWWLHDLRRTAVSSMARLGTPPHVIERVLNHISGIQSGVASIYNRYGYLPEKRNALELWSKQLEQVVSLPGKTEHPLSKDHLRPWER